ncbi:ERF family protein [Alkalihalobacillus oceani]|uniref:ERF family protein n=1 Tax=Halalkalibacter oceani TaxID=1653776 RepID=A0A9X2DSL4_9BACI|nr:ERF family protein [Halalkalibacter oceani]MCM3716274.1 ERF family protein [Halalkalibacter oceani]
MNIYKKILNVQKKIEVLKLIPGQLHPHVPISQIQKKIKPLLEQEGLLLLMHKKEHVIHISPSEVKRRSNGFEKKEIENQILLEINIDFEFINVENPEDKLIIPWYGQGIANGTEKAAGLAYTYAEKTFFQKQFHLPSDEMDPDVRGQSLQDEEEEETIATDQITEIGDMLAQLVKARGTTLSNYLEFLAVSNISDIRRSDYEEIKAKVSNWLKEVEDENKKENENATPQTKTQKSPEPPRQTESPTVEKSKVSEISNKEAKPTSDKTSNKTSEESEKDSSVFTAEVSLVSIDPGIRNNVHYAKLILLNKDKTTIAAIARGEELVNSLDELGPNVLFNARLVQEGNYYILKNMEPKNEQQGA